MSSAALPKKVFLSFPISHNPYAKRTHVLNCQLLIKKLFCTTSNALLRANLGVDFGMIYYAEQVHFSMFEMLGVACYTSHFCVFVSFYI